MASSFSRWVFVRYAFLPFALEVLGLLSFLPSGVMNPISHLGGGGGAAGAANSRSASKNLLELIARIAAECVVLHRQQFGLVLQRVQPLGQALVGIGQFTHLPLCGGESAFVHGSGRATSNRPQWWNDGWEPITPPGQCATAECAAGLPRTPSDNRNPEEVDFGQCKMVCQISLLVPVAICNAAAGGGLPGTFAAALGKGGLCTWVCK